MTGYFTPELTVERPTGDGGAARYVRSYLIMRLIVGALGVVLPFALVLFDGGLFSGDPFPRDSLSAYYYSSVRELFVGALSAIGVFLITYKVAERGLDNTLSWFAGFFVALVALFPTTRPDGATALTPLQDKLGENVVGAVHYGSAALFISALAIITFFYGVREGARPQRPGNRPPKFWRWFHWICAGVIVAALLFMLVAHFTGEPDNALLIGETLSVWAFGVSWFMKGFELDIVLGG